MILRRVVMVIGLVVVLVGLTEIIIPAQMLDFTDMLMRPVVIRLLSVVELALGVILIVAALKRLVRLRTFVMILGVYLAVLSAVLFAAPYFLIDMVNAILLYRPHGVQMTVLWASGLLRIALGGALLWATARPPRPGEPAPVEHQ